MLSLRQAALDCPEKTALVLAEDSFPFRDLWERVRPLCRWLEASCPAPVGVVAERRLDSMLLLYALMETGTPAVLLHPGWAPAERGAAIAAAGLQFVAGPDFRVDELPELQPGIGSRRQQLGAPHSAGSTPDDETLLAVVFTSGSSGQPRGVLLSRRAILASAAASTAHLGGREADRWLLTMPLAHVGGLSIVTRALIARHTLVVQPEGRFDPRQLASLANDTGISLLSVVPTMLARLLDERPRIAPPTTLRAVLVGGALAPGPLMAEARQRGWPVLATYGLTEAASQVATQSPGAPPGPAGSVGSPLPGIEVRVRGGAVEVRGDVLFDGYLDHEGGTAQPGPSKAPGPRARNREAWFATGDQGRIADDGSLQVFGRRGDLIRTGGEQVHPFEVESVLLESASVAEACVFGVDDREWGQRVYAAIVTDPATPLPHDSLNALLRERLAPWKRPSRLVPLAHLPLGPNGKVDREAVRDAALAVPSST